MTGNPRFGVCACCGVQGATGRRAPLVREHNHLTGHVRGYVCFPCNARVGYFEASISDPIRALQVLRYLKRTDPFWESLIASAPDLGAVRHPEGGVATWRLLYVVPGELLADREGAQA